MNAVEIAPSRTWIELRDEVQSRTDRQVYPMTGMLAEDVETILADIHSLDRDEWGRAWSAMARTWMARGDDLAEDDAGAAAGAFLMAWRYAAFGAWPIAVGPEKETSYALSLEAFGRYGSLLEHPIERVRIDLPDGGVVTCYLQLPAGGSPAPVVVSIGGLDSYKEYVAERYGPVYLRNGYGFVAVDAPHTGEAQVDADRTGERIYTAVIDHLVGRTDIDASRIGVQGVSMGGYWATKVAVAEADRLCFAVNWAGPLHEAWSAEQLRASLGSREYLFDLPKALLTVWGYDTIEALVAGQHRMSIVEQGLLERPTPRMLVVNGLKDSLVPATDTLLLLEHGEPKSAWINPNGFHLGRSAEWNDERIMSAVIMPWILEASPDRG